MLWSGSTPDPPRIQPPPAHTRAQPSPILAVSFSPSYRTRAAAVVTLVGTSPPPCVGSSALATCHRGSDARRSDLIRRLRFPHRVRPVRRDPVVLRVLPRVPEPFRWRTSHRDPPPADRALDLRRERDAGQRHEARRAVEGDGHGADPARSTIWTCGVQTPPPGSLRGVAPSSVAPVGLKTSTGNPTLQQRGEPPWPLVRREPKTANAVNAWSECHILLTLSVMDSGVSPAGRLE